MRFKIIAVIGIMLISTAFFQEQVRAQQSYVSFQVFYDQLSPYGQWIDYQDRGFAWIPNEGPDFMPYSTEGYWVFTNYGWTWVSNYPWGWAPFHYGRWNYDNFYGWLWFPDNEWGPSWVNWRRSDGYYGWSPMEYGMSISVSFGMGYNRDNDHWMFVRDRDFERHDLNGYYADRSDREMIIRNSTVINTTYIDNSRHTTYVAGPARNDVQRVTGRRISPVSVQENSRPGQNVKNGQMQIYRPQVQKRDNNRRSAPLKVTNITDVRPVNERNKSNSGQGNTRLQNQQNDVPQQRQQDRQQQQNAVTPKTQNDRSTQPQQQQLQLERQQKQQQEVQQQQREQQQLQQKQPQQQQIERQQQEKKQQQQEMRQQQQQKQPQQQQQKQELQKQQPKQEQQQLERQQQQKQLQQQQQQERQQQQKKQQQQTAQPQNATPAGSKAPVKTKNVTRKKEIGKKAPVKDTEANSKDKQ